MDILLSLPLFSYFLTTSTSSSSYLNFLFFYLTWSTLVLSHSPLKIEVLATLAIRLVFWLLPSLAFLLFDTLLPSLARGIKHNRDGLPPRDLRYLARLLALVLLNLALATAAQAALSLAVSRCFLAGDPVFRTSTTLPLPWQILKHLALMLAMREVLTYYIHRYLLHARPGGASLPSARGALASLLPSRLAPRNGNSSTSAPAKQTQRAARFLTRAHEGTAHSFCSSSPSSSPSSGGTPFSLLLAADHPLPFLLHRLVPLYLPAVLLHRDGLHLLTFLLFAALCTAEETLAMSGYTVVPGILMSGMARRTAAHYHRHAFARGRPAGNFGCWGVLDWAHGTSVGGAGDLVGDVRAEAEKHALRERAAGAGEGLLSGLAGEGSGSGSGKTRKGRGRKGSE